MRRRHASLSLVLVLAGCGTTQIAGSGRPDPAMPPPPPPRTDLTYAITTELPTDLLPMTVAGNTVFNDDVLARVLLRPFRVMGDNTVQPDRDLLAEDPTSRTEDGRQVVTYRIRPEAVWSDGTPITAADFRATWNLQKSDCEDLVSTDGYDQIQAVEDGGNGVVTVRFGTPYGDWRQLFQLLPAHKLGGGASCAILHSGWPTDRGMPDHIASGPFQITAATDTTLTLTANPRWWGAKPPLAKITVRAVGFDPSALPGQLSTHDADVARPAGPVDAGLIRVLQAVDGYQVAVARSLTQEHLDFNLRNTHLTDLKVRQALALALDRPALVEQTFGGLGLQVPPVNNRLYVPGQPEYRDNSGGRYDRPDPAGARQLLEQAGYRRGGDGIYARNGRRLDLRVTTTVGNSARAAVVQQMATQAREAGIALRPRPEPNIFGDATKSGSLASGQFDVALYAWVTGPYLGSFRSVFVRDGDQNYTAGSDPEVDRLFGEVVGTTDPAQVADLANRIDTALWERMFTLPLHQRPTVIVTGEKVHGVVDGGLTGPMWNCDQWSATQ